MKTGLVSVEGSQLGLFCELELSLLASSSLELTQPTPPSTIFPGIHPQFLHINELTT